MIGSYHGSRGKVAITRGQRRNGDEVFRVRITLDIINCILKGGEICKSIAIQASPDLTSNIVNFYKDNILP